MPSLALDHVARVDLRTGEFFFTRNRCELAQALVDRRGDFVIRSRDSTWIRFYSLSDPFRNIYHLDLDAPNPDMHNNLLYYSGID